MGDPQDLQSSLLGEDRAQSELQKCDEKSGRGEVELYDAERFITFTDAVVAIAMTLLILPLMDAASEVGGDEEESPSTASGYFQKNWEKIVSFAISFFVVAAFWVMHDRLFRQVEHFSVTLMRLNFLWMFGVVCVPVTASLFNEAPDDDLVSTTIYIGNMFVIACVNLISCILVRRDESLLKDGCRMPGSMFIASNVISIILLFFAWLLAALVPQVGALGLILLASTKLITRFLKKMNPEWKY